jgi:hypothetical protein
MKEDIRLLEQHSCQVFCPCKVVAIGCDGSTAVSDASIIRHAPDAWNSVLEARKTILEKQLTETIRKEERERLEAEQARLAALSAQELRVHGERQHILEELLTLKCPRAACRQAFVDFEGCFALKCGVCGCGFCAWCLEDCRADAHAHVLACPQKPRGNGGYHGSREDFERFQCQRRKGLVRQHLQQLDPDTRHLVVERCHKELDDLQMHDLVLEFRGNLQAPNAAAERAGAERNLNADLDEQLALQLHMDEVDDDQPDY